MADRLRCARPGCSGLVPLKATPWQRYCGSAKCKRLRSAEDARGASRPTRGPTRGHVSLCDRPCESRDEPGPEHGCASVIPAGSPSGQRFCPACAAIRTERNRASLAARRKEEYRGHRTHFVSHVTDRRIAARVAAQHGEDIA